MNDRTAIQSALDAEQSATKAVDDARRLAAEIHQAALDQARQIDSRAQARASHIRAALDLRLDGYRKSVEARGAEALRQLRGEAIDSQVMASTIDSVVRLILTEKAVGEREQQP
jgi:hypothetical protein